MENNWRDGLVQDSRNRIVNRIMDTLQRHTPLSGQDGMSELWKIANRFEEKIFFTASDQHDYLRKISSKMLNLETRPSTMPASSTGTNQSAVRPLEPGMAQVQSRQQVVQPAQAGMLNNGLQGSAGGQALSFSNISSVTQQAPSLNVLGQPSSNLPGPLTNNTNGGQAQSALQASQERIAQLQHARQQQQQHQQQQQQQQAQQHVGSQQGVMVQQQQPFLGQLNLETRPSIMPASSTGTNNWRAGLTQDSRNKIVNRIMDTLQRHTPLSGQDGMSELWKIANRFEEKIFFTASDRHDYLRKISSKMVNLETRPSTMPASSTATS